MHDPGAEIGGGEPAEVAPSYKYWAFISYSHQDNVPSRKSGETDCLSWGNWLHETLETYRVPAEFRGRVTATGEEMPVTFHPCFRDEAELPTSADLAGEIRRALDRSRYLIVIASPRSARSRYVNEEVRYFRELGRGQRILAIIIDGEPNVRLYPKDGWSEKDECFCPALVHPLAEDGSVDENYLLAEETIAADVRVKDTDPPREMRSRESRRPLQAQLLEHMKLKLVASLMGAGLDELVQRDHARKMREEKLRRTRNQRVALIFGVLFLVAVGLGFLAMHRGRLAEQARLGEEKQQRFAEEQKKLADAQILLAEEQKKLAAQRTADAAKAQAEEKEARKRHLLALIESARADRQTAHGLLGSSRESEAFAYLARAAKDEASIMAELSGPIGAVLREAIAESLRPNGKIAATDGLRALLTWRRIYPSRVFKGWGGDAQFTPDGKTIVTAQGFVLDALSGKVLHELAAGVQSNQVADRLSVDGKRYVTAALLPGPGMVHVWDVPSGKRIADIQPKPEPPKMAPGGMPPPMMVVPGGGGMEMPADMKRNEHVSTLYLNPERHTREITHLAFSANGLLVVTSSKDWTARLWDAQTGRLLRNYGGEMGRFMPGVGIRPESLRMNDAGFRGEFNGGPVRSANLSPDGRRLVTVHTDRSSNDDWTPMMAAVWDVQTGQLLTRLDFPSADRLADGASGGNGYGVAGSRRYDRLDFQFSPDGKLILGCRGTNIYLWAAEAPATQSNQPALPQMGSGGQQPVALLRGNLDNVNSIRFSPDGQSVLSAGEDKTARRWWLLDSATMIQQASERAQRGQARFPGLVPMTPAAGNAEPPPGIDPQVYRHDEEVYSAEWSPDSKRVVTASKDKTARLWNGRGDALLLGGFSDEVVSARFSADGARIVTTAKDGWIRVWQPGFYEKSWPAKDDGPDLQGQLDGKEIARRLEEHKARKAADPMAGVDLPSPPAWLPEFFTYLGGYRFAANGAIEMLKPDEWLTVRDKLRGVLRASVGAKDPYAEALRRWVEAD